MSVVAVFAGVAGFMVLACGAGIYGLQRHLLFPTPKAAEPLHSPHHRIEDIAVAVNGKVLRGHLATPRASSAPPRGLLYFNGRRENPTSIFRALAALPDHHVLCFYQDRLGPSWRKPGEEEMAADSLAVLDWWVREGRMPIERISVAGRSLGSGFAVQAAAARAVGNLVLVSPADQLITAIRSRWPWAPQWCLRDAFDSRSHIGQVTCRCLLIVADEDVTIPVEASRALFETWSGALTEFVVRRCGHRGVLKRADVHRALADFLREQPAAQEPV
jgi:pimeloyl-ACP methyl ester carboxylesterase